MVVNVRRIDGAEASPTGLNFRRLTNVKANIRRGYQIQFAPYPGTQGKWLIRLVRPSRGNPTDYKVDSYFEVVARDMDEAEDFIKKDGLWGGALMERIAHRIGKRGEAHAVRRFSSGGPILDASTGQTLRFDMVKQYQNASDNGLDVLARLARDAEPSPPPHAGDFMALEVKSTLGAADNPPGLSRAQRDDPREFVRSRLDDALEGRGSYPSLSGADEDIIEDALDALARASGATGPKMHLRRVGIRMDHAGQLASTGGRPEMEFKSW